MKQLSFSDFSGRLDDADVRLIDVREPAEYEEVHVRGAELHPLSKIRSGQLPEFDDREVFVICRSGGRSAMACQIFERAGVACTNISDGTLGAIAAGDEHLAS